MIGWTDRIIPERRTTPGAGTDPGVSTELATRLECGARLTAEPRAVFEKPTAASRTARRHLIHRRELSCPGARRTTR